MNIVQIYQSSWRSIVIEIDNNSPLEDDDWCMELLTDQMAALCERLKKKGCFVELSHWYAYSPRMGWRRTPGSKHFRALGAYGLVSEISPAAGDWRMTINILEETFECMLYHHDSPTGDKIYVSPITTKEDAK